MTIDSARGFFEALAARGSDARLTDAVGTWQFDVDGRGTWTVEVDRGALRVSEGPPKGHGGAPATTRVRLDEGELLRLARGDGHENLLMGLIRGALAVEGDLAFGQRLQSILPITEAST
jgi:hypothetical protein